MKWPMARYKGANNCLEIQCPFSNKEVQLYFDTPPSVVFCRKLTFVDQYQLIHFFVSSFLCILSLDSIDCLLSIVRYYINITKTGCTSTIQPIYTRNLGQNVEDKKTRQNSKQIQSNTTFSLHARGQNSEKNWEVQLSLLIPGTPNSRIS